MLHAEVEHWHGSKWKLFQALVENSAAGCALWNAHCAVAAQFAAVVEHVSPAVGLRALVVDSKLLPVCTALASLESHSAAPPKVTAVVSDPLDAMACELLLAEHATRLLNIPENSIAVLRQSLGDLIEEWHRDQSPFCESRPLRALFLGYDNAKPISMPSLQRAWDQELYTLRELDELLQMKVLSPDGVLAVLVPHASTGQ